MNQRCFVLFSIGSSSGDWDWRRSSPIWLQGILAGELHKLFSGSNLELGCCFRDSAIQKMERHNEVVLSASGASPRFSYSCIDVSGYVLHWGS